MALGKYTRDLKRHAASGIMARASQAINASGLAHAEIARRMGVCREFVWHVANMQRNLGISNLLPFCDVLEIDPIWLLRGDGK